MADSSDPRWFISTKEQRQQQANVLESEPQQLLEEEGRLLLLGSRECVVNAEKRRRLVEELGVRYVVMCCDRAPDVPKLFEYLHVSVNNESRDSGDQHLRHVHDDHHEEGGCSHGEGGCGDLHLLKWIVREGTETKCLADEVCEWIDARISRGDGNVLIHGYDGVTNSAAVAIAYLMWKKSLRLTDAIALVEKQRPIVRLTPPISRDLQIWDTRLVLSRTKLKNRIIPKRNKTP